MSTGIFDSYGLKCEYLTGWCLDVVGSGASVATSAGVATSAEGAEGAEVEAAEVEAAARAAAGGD